MYLEEQLITTETLALAKEKGFIFRQLIICSFEIDGKGYELESRGVTQACLQQWLRDVHKTHIMIRHFSDCPTKFFNDESYDDSLGSYEWRMHRKEDQSSRDYCEDIECLYETYEEALEKALIEALKLLN